MNSNRSKNNEHGGFLQVNFPSNPWRTPVHFSNPWKNLFQPLEDFFLFFQTLENPAPPPSLSPFSRFALDPLPPEA
jgi:hypothetical protein